MKNNLFFDLLQYLGMWGMIVLSIILIAFLISLMRDRNEAARTWKSRTVAYIALTLVSLLLPQVWVIVVPLYLVLAYRSYKAGHAMTFRPAGTGISLKVGFGLLGAWLVKTALSESAFDESNSANKISDAEYKYDGAGCPYPYPGAEYQTFDASKLY
jgi:multisubunit Na+/H+ antiporter MnhB subunit